MKIEISQNANGVDVVTIDGLSVSAAVSLAILTAVDLVESIQHNEANASWDAGHCTFCGKALSQSPEHAAGFCDEGCYYAYTEGGSEEAQYGTCSCGGPSCDGTCDTNVEHRRAMLDQEYSAGCVGCISGGCDECSEHNQFADEVPF